MKYFTIAELCASSTATKLGIKNVPNEEQISNLGKLINNVLDPLREWYKRPINISSGFRCLKLNAAVGGVSTSEHCKGMAADIKIPSLSEGKKMFEYIKTHLYFRQLIWEHNKSGVYWIHVSYNEGNNKKQVIENLLKK